MLQLLERLLAGRRPSDAYNCILLFPDSKESRSFSELPIPGARIYSYGGHYYFGKVWVVDEVLQSGRDTYTVFLVGRDEYLARLRGSTLYPDLGEELLEVARHAAAIAKEQRRRWKYRHRLF
jgi:hypothetical protein